MKFTLKKCSSNFWNGNKPLPDEINVISTNPHIAEFELLTIISILHGYVTPFDILTGADSHTEKDKDIASVLTAFQRYIYPKMPISNYTSSDHRILSLPIHSNKIIAIDSLKIE